MNEFSKRKISFILLFTMATGNNSLAMQMDCSKKPEINLNRSIKTSKGLSAGAKTIAIILPLVAIGSIATFAILKGKLNNKKIENNKTFNQINDIENNNEFDHNNNEFCNNPKDNNFEEEESHNSFKTSIHDDKENNAEKHYELLDKGRVQITNPILDIDLEQVMAADNFNDSKIFGLARLSDLCQKYGITKGIEVDDGNNGWDIPAYDYFFVDRGNYTHYSHMYDRLSDYHKKLLLQCIEIMYRNQNNEEWRDIVEACLTLMSSHGAHCAWRAEAIVNNVYSNLVKFLRDKGEILGNDLGGAFCELKEKLVGNVHADYIKNNPDNNEPLDDINKIVKGMKYKFGMPGGDEFYEDYAGDYFKNAMKADNLIKLSHAMLDKLESDKRALLMFNEELPISFEEYCKYTMKTPKQIKTILDKIGSYDTDEARELKSWIQNKKKLSFGYMSADVMEVFGCKDELVYDLTKYNFGIRFLINLIKNDYLYLVDDE